MSGEWTKVGGGGNAVNVKNEGEVSGIYLSKEENAGPNASTIYNLEQPDGTTVAVWGSTVIDTKMSNVPVGSEVRIVYLDEKKNPKTGRTFQDYDVFTREAEPSKTLKKAKEDAPEEDSDEIPF